MLTHETLTVIEPFCGAGGMALGLHRAGFRCLDAFDTDKDAIATLQGALLDVPARVGDARDGSSVETCDLLAAGVPCQPFSAAGKGLGKWDPRDGFPHFLKMVEKLRPRAILIENVRGLTFKKHLPYLECVAAELIVLGYYVLQGSAGHSGQVLNAADYGAPQKRQRLILVAFRDVADAARWKWPEATHTEEALVWAKWGEGVKGGIEGGGYWMEHTGNVDPKHPPCDLDAASLTVRSGGEGHDAPPMYADARGVPSKKEETILKQILAGKREVRGKRWRTVRDAIGDLGDLEGQNIACRRGREAGTQMEGRSVDDCSVALRGSAGGSSQPFLVARNKESGRDVSDRPSDVILGGAQGVASLHTEGPEPKLRRLTARECARLQGFPDDFVFTGTKTAQYRQIGNAVPPPLAEAVGRAIRAALEDGRC